jgi:thiosulfate dehydrogenase [quinone] large subunit
MRAHVERGCEGKVPLLQECDLMTPHLGTLENHHAPASPATTESPLHGATGEFLGMGHKSAAYLMFRMALGFDMFMHGASRFIAGLQTFVDGLVRDFQATILPSWTVRALATSFPFVEVVIGLFFVVGFATRWALAAGLALMCVFFFGTALQGKTDVVAQQLLYAAAFSALLATVRWNRFAIDTNCSRAARPATTP